MMTVVDGVVATSLRRLKRGTRPPSDVNIDQLARAGQGIAECLRVKGFCVINDAVNEDVFDEAVSSIQAGALDFRQPPVLVQEGLLGMEGSFRIAKVESSAGFACDTFQPVDQIIMNLANAVGPYQELIGFHCTTRSVCVVHEAAEPSIEETDMTDQEANEWHAVFTSHKILILVFLGPDRGTLELTPYDDDANPTDLSTFPGQAVLLRTDQLSYRFSTRGSKANYVASSFLLQNDILGLHPIKVKEHMGPAAKELESWIYSRLREIKENEGDEPDWGELEATIPRNFISVANRTFFNRTMTAVRGCALREPSCWEPEVFVMGLTTGCDVVVEVPLCRWDHSDVYDSAPDSWKMQPAKTSCRHASFCEGVDLFDNKMFSLSFAEVKGMDPSQRQVLETTFEALCKSGKTKASLINSSTGMYVGMGTSEWNYAERSADVGIFGATGGAPSICAGRLSFCLGCKGASLAVDTEAASGLSAVYWAAESVERKGLGVHQELACGIGVHMILARQWWPTHSAAGFLSTAGRCLAFDACADGYVREEGTGCIVVASKPDLVVDGETVKDELPSIGNIVGGATMNSGFSAGMCAPSGPTEQALVSESCRKSGIMTYDVYIVECHAAGKMIADAVEVASLGKALREGASDEMLTIGSKKTNVGNGMEVSGICSLAKILFSTRWGWTVGSIHLNQLNPHLDISETPLQVCSEHLENQSQVFCGVSSYGFGGTLVHVQTFGGVDEEIRPPPEPVPEELKPRLTYWPAGGGHLDMESRPRKGFFISGTWNSWQPEQMTDRGEGYFSTEIVLGENGWEQFQITIDGSESKILCPGFYKAPKGTQVFGPMPKEEVETSRTWCIDARGIYPQDRSAAAGDEQLAKIEDLNSDAGRPGDRYQISLHVAGKWRTVTWSRLASDPEALVPLRFGRYFVAGTWNDWAFEEMTADPSTPGLFRVDVKVKSVAGEQFLIVRNQDWLQTFGPIEANAESHVPVYGPEERYQGFEWSLRGKVGEKFTIEFQRQLDGSKDRSKVSWHSSA